MHIVDARVRLPMELRPAADLQGISASYEAIFHRDPLAGTVDHLLAEMSDNGVEHAIVHAEYEVGDPADHLNEATAKLVSEHPDRLTGVGTISQAQAQPMRCVRQVARVAALGLVGINVQPAFFGRAIDDRELYPVYAKAVELGLFVALHTGVNYDTRQTFAGEEPIRLDRVLCDFPEGRFIALHAGWPWVAEMVAVARRHPRLLMDFGGMAPKYLGLPGSGWEVMYRFMGSLLQEQVMFATNWPVFGMERSLREWRALGLESDVLAKALGGNAASLLTERAGAT